MTTTFRDRPGHPPRLTVTDLTKSFVLHAIDARRIPSLEGVSLQVGADEHVALAGSSGAGKSSLLRCVYRTYLPDSGRVVLHRGTAEEPDDVELTALDDRSMARLRGLDIGYVSQFLHAPPRTGPRDVVCAAALRRGLDRTEAEEASAHALRALGIDETLWDVDCAVLSGGERQRINLAAGTVHPPRLLLLDEPVSALDPANRERALQHVERLRSHDVAILAVYHDMEVIRRLADRVVVLAGGVVVADGDPADVLAGGHPALASAGAEVIA
ncbi:MAG TPA: ATP-binding cassette domain-containing protein [Actinomycetales bacterium]|nr:ATP-binding cassette domain-containing protein [Actinomycetales bacterium]